MSLLFAQKNRQKCFDPSLALCSFVCLYQLSACTLNQFLDLMSVGLVFRSLNQWKISLYGYLNAVLMLIGSAAIKTRMYVKYAGCCSTQNKMQFSLIWIKSCIYNIYNTYVSHVKPQRDYYYKWNKLHLISELMVLCYFGGEARCFLNSQIYA